MLSSIHRKLFFSVPSLSHLSQSEQEQKLQELKSNYQQRFSKEYQQQTRDLKSSFTNEQIEKIELIHDHILKLNTFEMIALRGSVQSSQQSEFDWPIFPRPNDTKFKLNSDLKIPKIGPVSSITEFLSRLTSFEEKKVEVVKEVVEEVVEKTTFNLVLTGFDPSNKVKLIKAVKDAVGLGLKESKDKVEEVAKGPVILFKSVSKESHGKIQETLIAAGGKVEFL